MGSPGTGEEDETSLAGLAGGLCFLVKGGRKTGLGYGPRNLKDLGRTSQLFIVMCGTHHV